MHSRSDASLTLMPCASRSAKSASVIVRPKLWRICDLRDLGLLGTSRNSSKKRVPSMVAPISRGTRNTSTSIDFPSRVWADTEGGKGAGAFSSYFRHASSMADMVSSSSGFPTEICPREMEISMLCAWDLSFGRRMRSPWASRAIRTWHPSPKTSGEPEHSFNVSFGSKSPHHKGLSFEDGLNPP